MEKIYTALGLMSGTSLDGIDASIIRSDGEKFINIEKNEYYTYNDKFQDQLREFIIVSVILIFLDIYKYREK